jgi:hypothetical protein
LQSLWNLLSLKRLILLTEHGQDGFDKIDGQYKVMIENQTEDEVSLDQENDASEANSTLYDKNNENSSNSKSLSNFELALIEKICKEKKFINLTNLFNFINLLYKLIVFKLMHQNKNDENVLWEVSLKEILVGLIEEWNLDMSSKSEEAIDLEEFDLSDFKLKNVMHLWKLVVNIYILKKNL